MLTYWLTLIICFNDLCFLITKCKVKINTGKGQHNCHQNRCWDNLHEIDPHQSKMCRRNKLMASWQFFFQLAPCVLLPSFPTHKQNTAIHQHGRNCSQPCKASTRVLSQMIRTCLHSLRMPHVRGTDILPTGRTRAQPRIQGGKWLPAQGSHTHPLLPWAWHSPCQVSEEGSKSLLHEGSDPPLTEEVNSDVVPSSVQTNCRKSIAI